MFIFWGPSDFAPSIRKAHRDSILMLENELEVFGSYRYLKKKTDSKILNNGGAT